MLTLVVLDASDFVFRRRNSYAGELSMFDRAV